MSVFVVHVVSVQVVLTLSQDDRARYQHVVNLQGDERAYFELRRRWRNGEFPAVSGMMPVIKGTFAVAGRMVPVIGIDPLADVETGGFVGEEDALAGEFLVSNTLIAQGTALEVGDSLKGVRVLSKSEGMREQLLMDISTAQELLERRGQLDEVWVRAEASNLMPPLEEFWPGVASGFGGEPATLAIAGFDVQPMDAWNPFDRFSDSIAFNLGMLGVLALFVAGFIVYEAIWSDITRRQLEVTRLISLGVARSKIRMLFLIEVACLATIGSILGVLMGLAFLTVVLAAQVPVQFEAINWIAVFKAVFVGLATALCVAWLATRPRRRSATGTALSAIVICSVLLALYGLNESSGLAGAFLVVVCMCAVHLAAVVPVVIHLLWRGCIRLRPTSLLSRLNLRTAIQSLHQLRTPFNALSVAIASAMGLGLMVDSFEQDFTQVLDRRVQAGLHLSSAANVDTGQLAQFEGVVGVRSYHRAQGALESTPVEVIAANLDPWEAARYGYDDALPDGLLIDEQAQRRTGLGLGDVAEIQLAGGSTISLPIAHVYSSFGDATGSIVVHRNNVDLRPFIRDRITVQLATGEQEIVHTLRSRYPEIGIASHTQIREVAVEIFDRTFVLANAIATIAIVVALVGLTATLSASFASRSEEFRLLRTLGVSKHRTYWMSMTQMITFGIVVAVASVPLGVGISWALCELVNPRAFDWTIELRLLARPLWLPALIGFIGVFAAGIATATLQARMRAFQSQPHGGAVLNH